MVFKYQQTMQSLLGWKLVLWQSSGQRLRQLQVTTRLSENQITQQRLLYVILKIKINFCWIVALSYDITTQRTVIGAAICQPVSYVSHWLDPESLARPGQKRKRNVETTVAFSPNTCKQHSKTTTTYSSYKYITNILNLLVLH